MSEEPMSRQRRWARFRLAVIAALLAAPPRRGLLREEIEKLSARGWTHPVTGEPMVVAFSTIERWYYSSRRAEDPLRALQRRVRADAGEFRLIGTKLIEAILVQYRDHPRWSYWLHYRNFKAQERKDPELEVPSYSTVRRFMNRCGLRKQRKGPTRNTDAARRARARLETREVRSFEVHFVGQLWHSDFHHCSRQVLLRDGRRVTPVLCAVIDDHSRLVCHGQWYLEESAENYVHCICQAFGKRGLPREWLQDNGSAMKAGELRSGLARLSIERNDTLEYSPDQNGKIENLWATVEGRLMPQLESVQFLTLDLLNEATIAFFEFDFNREAHRETKERPLDRFLGSTSVLRPCPSRQVLLESFTLEEARTQRQSDGTITVEGVRFEIPSAYRHLDRLTIRYARWDLSHVFLTDPRSDQVLGRLLPLDRQANSDGRRKTLPPGGSAGPIQYELPSGIAPYLLEQIQKLRATGLPTPYLHKDI